jgi:hypothetical protein
LTSASEHLTPYTDLFLSTKKKHKPVTKKVRLVIGELPEKFQIECKIISNPLNDLPVLNPNPLPFIPTNRYTLKQGDQLNKNHPGSFLWPVERDLMYHFMLAHNSGFAWSEEEQGGFRLISFHLSISLSSPIPHGWSITSLFLQVYTKTYVLLFRKSLLLASMSHQTHLIALSSFVS